MSQARLEDSLGRLIAVAADVKLEDDVWSTQCILVQVPEFLRLFHAYEDAVNGQMFTLVDTLEQQIAGLGPRLVETSGQSVAIEDLQIFPNAGVGSWRVVRSSLVAPHVDEH